MMADNKQKIIVGVDDNELNLRLLEVVIKSQNYTFMGADSGAACLDLVGRVEPTLILLDVAMPDMDGFETCRRLRAIPRLARVPIMFVTAFHAPRERQAAIDAGGNDFLSKPIIAQALLDRVQHWVFPPGPGQPALQ